MLTLSVTPEDKMHVLKNNLSCSAEFVRLINRADVLFTVREKHCTITLISSNERGLADGSTILKLRCYHFNTHRKAPVSSKSLHRVSSVKHFQMANFNRFPIGWPTLLEALAPPIHCSTTVCFVLIPNLEMKNEPRKSPWRYRPRLKFSPWGWSRG